MCMTLVEQGVLNSLRPPVRLVRMQMVQNNKQRCLS